MDHERWLRENGEGSYAPGAGGTGDERVYNVDWSYLVGWPEENVPAPEPFDEVDRPKHYNLGGIECIDAIKASMTKEEFEGYLKGSVMKYLWRYRYKGKPLQDLAKAQWYLARLAVSIES